MASNLVPGKWQELRADRERESPRVKMSFFFSVIQKGQADVSHPLFTYRDGKDRCQRQKNASIANLLEIGNRYLTPPICHGVVYV